VPGGALGKTDVRRWASNRLVHDPFVDVMVPEKWRSPSRPAHRYVPQTLDYLFAKRRVVLYDFHCARPPSDVNRKIREVAAGRTRAPVRQVRRKLRQAQFSDIMRSMVMLAYGASAGLVYDVERGAREMKLDAKGPFALRQTRSVPTLHDIKAYLQREQPNVLSKSPAGQNRRNDAVPRSSSTRAGS